MAVELCEMSLAKYIRNNKDVSLAVKFDLAVQASEGLAFLHENQWLHRDLKPSNILLKTEDGGKLMVKLTDMGLVKGLEDSASQLSSKLDYAAMAWIAPELYVKPGDFTTSSDVWALGCVIFYSFTGGRHPFDSPEGRSLADRATNIIKKRTNWTPLQQTDISNITSHPNVNLQFLIAQMISDGKSERPSTKDVVIQLKIAQEKALKIMTALPARESLVQSNSLSKVLAVMF